MWYALSLPTFACFLEPITAAYRGVSATRGMEARVTAFINYYAREGQVHHVQSVCNEILKRGPNPVLLFWRAYGLLAEGASAEVGHRTHPHPVMGMHMLI